MTSHLSPAILNALVDGELSPEQLASANEHLAGCPSCTTSALSQSLLKSATTRAGHRYTPPPRLLERLTAQASSRIPQQISQPGETPRLPWKPAALGWAAAAILLLASVTLVLVQRGTQQTQIASNNASVESAALVTEVCDQHIATLAASLPPQVLSSDRHTVKPWFQGKIPFSFNLPEDLPAGTKLDGANLTYIHNQPVAQLLYSVGKHRASVFVTERTGPPASVDQVEEHSGFHIITFDTGELRFVAASDVEPARLSELAGIIAAVQTNAHPPAKKHTLLPRLPQLRPRTAAS